MKRLFQISRYPSVLVFLLAGVSVVVFAFQTYNLLQMGMANLRYIREHGLLALQTGALIQLLQLMFFGAIALFFFLVFKVCESELVIRYRRWMER